MVYKYFNTFLKELACSIWEEFFEKNISRKHPLEYNFPFLISLIYNMLFPASNRKIWL